MTVVNSWSETLECGIGACQGSARLGSRSARCLVIVAHEHRELYDYLTRILPEDQLGRIVLDRRSAQDAAIATERRHRPEADGPLQSNGMTVVDAEN